MEQLMKHILSKGAALALVTAAILSVGGCFRPEPPEILPLDETSAQTTATTFPETTAETIASTEATNAETDPPETGATTTETTVTETDPPESAAEPTIETIDGMTYVNGILIVNKTYPLPKNYAPGMDETAYEYLSKMFTDAKTAGLTLRVASSYRSYVDQYIIYNDYVARDGQAAADTYSARPGHSEHQSGLAFDLKSPAYDGLTLTFADTPEGIWVAEHCHEYGFIIRYPKGKEEITGYMYEPWHIRYLGVDTATEVFESGLCLEEFLSITSEYEK